jgi:hypothetical protein
MAEAIQLIGCHAGPDEWLYIVEHFRSKAPGDAHLFNFPWCLDGNAHGGGWRKGCEGAKDKVLAVILKAGGASGIIPRL